MHTHQGHNRRPHTCVTLAPSAASHDGGRRGTAQFAAPPPLAGRTSGRPPPLCRQAPLPALSPALVAYKKPTPIGGGRAGKQVDCLHILMGSWWAADDKLLQGRTTGAALRRWRASTAGATALPLHRARASRAASYAASVTSGTASTAGSAVELEKECQWKRCRACTACLWSL